MKRILIASDFTNIANNAMMYGLELAKLSHRNVVLFHLYKPSKSVAHSLAGPQIIDQLVEKKRTEVALLAAKLQAEFRIEITPIVTTGEFLESINEVIEKQDCGLLVLGMPEKSIEQELLGNITTEAIFELKLPVLAVPEFAKFEGMTNILYACDVTRGIHAKVLATVKEYAHQLNANVHIFSVGKADIQAKDAEHFATELEGVTYDYKNVQAESVIQAIKTEAESIHADLIIMTPHKYSFWESLVHRSKTRIMASNGKTPLLSIAY